MATFPTSLSIFPYVVILLYRWIVRRTGHVSGTDEKSMRTKLCWEIGYLEEGERGGRINKYKQIDRED